MTRRRQLVRMRAAEQQHRKQASPVVRHGVDRAIAFFNRELEEIDEDLTRRLRESPLWRERDELLRSVPGVGPALTFVLLADLPELGSLSNKQVASLVGLAPFARDSGKFRGARTCWGGRAAVRAALYMPTVAAMRCNPVIKGFYEAAGESGQASKGCAHRVYAQAADGPQRHAPARDLLEPPDGLTSNTVACPSERVSPRGPSRSGAWRLARRSP